MPFMKIILLNLSTDESRTVSNATSFLVVIPSPSQSTSQTGHSHTNVFITAVCISVGFLLMLLVVILVTTVLLLGKQKQKRGKITSVLYMVLLLNYVYICMHFQMMPQSQIIFLLMTILSTLQ